MNHTKPLIEAEKLVNLSPSRYLLIDVSFGESSYQANHLTGAIYADLNSQLSLISDNPTNGGRHPLPTIKLFSERLGTMGITPTTHVILYDNKYGAMSAARFWWMLKAVGHEFVQVIDGGLQAAVAAGFPTESENNIPLPTSPYPVVDWKLPLSSLQEVEAVSKSGNHIIVDVRETDRYLGKTEPIDLIAGHIPGAINIPFAENLTSDGTYKSSETLKEKYEGAFGDTPPNNVIVHCGSGVTACHTLLALAHAGMEIPKLYVGSWSEWSRNGKPIATDK